MRVVLSVAAAALLLCAGCASDHAAKPGAVAAREIGMTKDQIVALYGRTTVQRSGAEGETWIYNLSASDSFVPWNVGYRPRLRLVEFDADGKVKAVSYSK